MVETCSGNTPGSLMGGLEHFLHVMLWYRLHFTLKCAFCPKATAEANNLAAVATAKDTYNKKMEEVRVQDFKTIFLEPIL